MEQTARTIMRNMRYQKQHGTKKDFIPQGVDLHQIREFNRLLVLNYIREHGPVARIKIAQKLGLSRTTITNIMGTLLQEELVHEGCLMDATSKGGRRAILVHFNADASHIMGIEVGRSHLIMLITNLASKIIAQHKAPFNIAFGPTECLRLLIFHIKEFIGEAPTSWECIAGIGLSLPGIVTENASMLDTIPHAMKWNNQEIQQQLQEAFHKPVYLENDANMGMLGEYRCGAGRGSTNMSYIWVDIGIGGGIMMNERIYRGHNGSAGEIGHVIIDEAGPVCACGNRGCLEAIAGNTAIINDAWQGKSLAHKNAQSEVDASALALVVGERKNIPGIILAAQQGDAACIAALEHAGTSIGLALGSLINLLNPLLIIINGEIIGAGELFFTPLRQTAARASFPPAWKDTRILPGTLGMIAGALGATLLVIDAAFTLPAISSPSFASHEKAYARSTIEDS